MARLPVVVWLDNTVLLPVSGSLRHEAVSLGDRWFHNLPEEEDVSYSLLLLSATCVAAAEPAPPPKPVAEPVVVSSCDPCCKPGLKDRLHDWLCRPRCDDSCREPWSPPEPLWRKRCCAPACEQPTCEQPKCKQPRCKRPRCEQPKCDSGCKPSLKDRLCGLLPKKKSCCDGCTAAPVMAEPIPPPKEVTPMPKPTSAPVEVGTGIELVPLPNLDRP